MRKQHFLFLELFCFPFLHEETMQDIAQGYLSAAVNFVLQKNRYLKSYLELDL